MDRLGIGLEVTQIFSSGYGRRFTRGGGPAADHGPGAGGTGRAGGCRGKFAP